MSYRSRSAKKLNERQLRRLVRTVLAEQQEEEMMGMAAMDPVMEQLKAELEQMIVQKMQEPRYFAALQECLDEAGMATVGDVLVQYDLPFNGEVEKKLTMARRMDML